MRKVKFITGNGNFGGSTIALMEHCRVLNASGHEATLYSNQTWCIERSEYARPMSEFKIDEDDILIYHLVEMRRRPKCARCYLYLHEKGLWDTRKIDTFAFDEVIFVSESQKAWHGIDGPIIPNPMGKMVDTSKHRPPGRNIAGVVGTIQSRKMQHISIVKAISDGVESVLLFGDYEPRYFESEIMPLFSDRVIYKGIFEPNERMSMYNQFDTLYIHSSDESASMALGECRMLGKPVVKGEFVQDYEIVSDDEVASRWSSLFSSPLKYIDEQNAIRKFNSDCESLVCLVTHNRKNFVSKWLKAWRNADKRGAKIVVFHAFDGDAPSPDERDNILQHDPDFYIPFRNTELRDMQAFLFFSKDKAGLPDWKRAFWFTDDLMPMRRDFLVPFDEKIRRPGVGIVPQCYEPKNGTDGGVALLPHIRTVGYAITREAMDSLSFPNVGEMNQRPYLFEHGTKGVYEHHILNQVLDAGFACKIAHSDTDVARETNPSSDYVHWTECLDWMWDCHLFSDGTDFGGKRISGEEYWSIYERQFVLSDDVDKYVLFSAKRCEEFSLIPSKICAVIPTYSSPMDCFMRSVFSLLLRSDPNVLAHVVFGINGPDSRCDGEDGPELQDRKQRFIEDLKGIKGWDYPSLFNPGGITLVRTWSRIGHAQTLEQCLNWVHTEYYLCMHDDVIVTDRYWCDGLKDFKSDPKMVLKTWGNPLMRKMQNKSSSFELPHLNTIFTLCRKPLMRMINANWIGYYFDLDFRISDFVDESEFFALHKNLGSLESSHPELSLEPGRSYKVCSMDIGTFVFSQVSKYDLNLSVFPKSTIFHFEAASWRNKEGSSKRTPEVEFLEREISAVPEYHDIYMRYLDVKK